MPGDLKYFDCPICQNKGRVAYERDGCIMIRDCECKTKRDTMSRIAKSGLTDVINRYKFSNYETAEEWQKTIKQKAIDYVANGGGKWFVISGTPGSGKTHICTAICRKLLNADKEVLYMLWRKEAPKLKALINDRAEYEKQMYKLESVDVLYIDDFFKSSVTEADINLAFELLNSRYNRSNAMTIISTERSIESLLEIDEGLASRIYEKSKDYCCKTPMGANWRMK